MKVKSKREIKRSETKNKYRINTTQTKRNAERNVDKMCYVLTKQEYILITVIVDVVVVVIVVE